MIGCYSIAGAFFEYSPKEMVVQTVQVEDSDNRIITISKSNITLDRGGFAYTIEPVQLANGVTATMVKWGAAVARVQRVKARRNPS